MCRICRGVSAFCQPVLVLIACGVSVAQAPPFRLAYKLSPGTTFFSTEQFGVSLAAANRVLVGAPGDGRGAVYLFTRKTRTPIATFRDNPHGDPRGTGVAVALAGRRVVVSEQFGLASVRVFVH